MKTKRPKFVTCSKDYFRSIKSIWTAYTEMILPGETYLGCAYSALVVITRFTYCSLFGHAWEDQGYAGPDSGCIDLVCTRCDYRAGRTVLY